MPDISGSGFTASPRLADHQQQDFAQAGQAAGLGFSGPFVSCLDVCPKHSVRSSDGWPDLFLHQMHEWEYDHGGVYRQGDMTPGGLIRR